MFARLLNLTVILCGLTHCGLPPPASGSCRPQPPRSFGLGVAHVAGSYSVRQQASETFLQAGALRARELGSTTLKLFLTPDFRTKYPQPWPQTISSLAQLADSPPFREVLAQPFDTFVLTTYSFSMGTADPWRDRPVDAVLAGEALELDELVTLLSTRYAGTGKTFVLQTWEGDWALRGSTAPGVVATTASAERMAGWLTARHEAIATARAREAHDGVTVVDAIEVNRVFDEGPSVINDVVPQACADLISYSAWESLEGRDPEVIESRLGAALALIHSRAPVGAAMMIGEMGFAENEETVSAPLVERTLSVASKYDVRGSVYWQMFDNECTAAEGCRGFWVMRPDGSLSTAGQTLATHWAAGD